MLGHGCKHSDADAYPCTQAIIARVVPAVDVITDSFTPKALLLDITLLRLLFVSTSEGAPRDSVGTNCEGAYHGSTALTTQLRAASVLSVAFAFWIKCLFNFYLDDTPVPELADLIEYQLQDSGSSRRHVLSTTRDALALVCSVSKFSIQRSGRHLSADRCPHWGASTKAVHHFATVCRDNLSLCFFVAHQSLDSCRYQASLVPSLSCRSICTFITLADCVVVCASETRPFLGLIISAEYIPEFFAAASVFLSGLIRWLTNVAIQLHILGFSFDMHIPKISCQVSQVDDFIIGASSNCTTCPLVEFLSAGRQRLSSCLLVSVAYATVFKAQIASMMSRQSLTIYTETMGCWTLTFLCQRSSYLFDDHTLAPLRGSVRFPEFEGFDSFGTDASFALKSFFGAQSLMRQLSHRLFSLHYYTLVESYLPS